MSTTPPIDWEHCLSITNQKSDLAHEILDMFMQELPSYRDQLQQHFQSESYEDLHQVVHKLHGATCYCGTSRLKSLLSKFETAIKAKQIDSFDDMYHDVMKEIESIEHYYESNEFKETHS